jgi:phosphoadenosine phosphosulfate reductase
MRPVATRALGYKSAAVREQLAASLARHGRLAYVNSLGAEAVVLTDRICSHLPQIERFSIDTGRRPEETDQRLAQRQRGYRRTLRRVYPDAAAPERRVQRQGVNGFYDRLEVRLDGRRVRKIEPLARAIAGFSAWVTAVRREPSAVRAGAEPVSWNAGHGLYQISPLLEWSEAEVWQYIRTHQLPYNALHDRQFPSIGCSPGTRATQPGESRRARRGWWEQSESRECGLQMRIPVPPRAQATPVHA